MYDVMAGLAKPGDRWSQMRYVALACLVGVLTGTIGSLFHLLIDAAQVWPKYLGRYLDGPMLVAAAALVTMCLTVVSVYIVRRFAPEAGGSGVQEIEGAMQGLRVVRWVRVLLVKFFAGITAIGSGLVLGREGPTIHIGASFAAGVTNIFGASETERRGMLGAGAAAGLACAFNAPLASILFIVEETHREFPYTFRTYMGVAVACVMSTVMTQIIGGRAPDFAMTVSAPELILLPAFLILGVVMGGLGVVLNAGLMTMGRIAASMDARLSYLFPALVGLAVGALFIVMPMAVTGGENLIATMASQNLGILVLLGLAVVRYFTMITSYSTGVPGGIFAPMLALSLCVGLAFGGVLDSVMPPGTVVPLAFGMAAMGGLFSGSVRAPIVGVALTLELTGAYTMVLPLIVTCVTANMVAQWLGGRPIYEQLLDRTLRQAGVDPKVVSKDHVGLA